MNSSRPQTTADLRQAFLEYFAEHGHRVVASSSLVPGNDPTLLFTNAGMVQFKDVFLGSEQRGYSRAVSAQRCVRAGGKHNDLENVGYTARHHTFFEMLGNFSFGDYFKREAIQYAWDFLTRVCGLPAERLWVTVYEEDDEAAAIWLEEIGVEASRFSRIGAEDNFWAMGDTGPCGPCSEIFYDHGADVAGGPPGSPEADGDRYVEIWNLVFMQFDRSADGTMHPLPKPCVDTGMGLERLAAVMQGVHANYDIDLFQHLIAAAAKATGCADHNAPSLRVMADHIRACAFLIADGVLPANDGRGYVLRRIIRRALRHGYKLGADESAFHQLVAPLVEIMGQAYPELVDHQAQITEVLAKESQRFGETLSQGMGLLEQALVERQGDALPGEVVFKLYDTYGFPVDLTRDIARERGLSVDEAGFEAAMTAQRQRARAAGQFSVADELPADWVARLAPTEFVGYDQHAVAGVSVVALSVEGAMVEAAEAGQSVMLILDRTPFYAESGGQVGDQGQLLAEGVVVDIHDTRKLAGSFWGHFGTLRQGRISRGDQLEARIDIARRRDIQAHHSATHLMHAALRQQLGSHVQQKGSLVADDRLRFDFSHPEPVTEAQLADIERWVNEAIQANVEAETREMAYDEAIAAGALAFFGDKYGDRVRVMRFGELSTELCGGTHVARMGDIGLFKLISEGGVSSGVRRIEALAGRQAIAWMQQLDQDRREMARALKSPGDQLNERVMQLLSRTRELEKTVGQLKSELAASAGADLLNQVQTVNGLSLIAANLGAVDPAGLRDAVDQLKHKLGSGIVVLAAEADAGLRLVVGVTKDLTDRVKAGELASHLAAQVGGKGGGRPDFAQAGGADLDALPAALQGVADWLAQRTG